MTSPAPAYKSSLRFAGNRKVPRVFEPADGENADDGSRARVRGHGAKDRISTEQDKWKGKIIFNDLRMVNDVAMGLGRETLRVMDALS